MMLPTSLKNFRKRPFTSEPFARKIPKYIPPLSAEREGMIIHTLLSEINAVCGLTLDESPDLRRDLDPATRSDQGRVAVIGASHMCRLVEHLLQAEAAVESHCRSGWKATDENLSTAEEYLTDLTQIKDDDVVLGQC